jgi:hypothetical protein
MRARSLGPFLVSALLAAPAAAAESASRVVVELFTSQGCSSCPDADQLLSSWGAKGFAAGELLPLSFNVDYWNYLGWRDLFSAPAWSQRQSRYAAALGARTYTPQMVVAGRQAFVGSDGRQAAAAAARFRGEPPRARLSIGSLPSPRARLDVQVEPLPAAAGLHVILVLFENGLVTEVSSGENGGRELKNDFVVRSLTDLGPLESGKTLKRRLEVPWESGWRKRSSGGAIFLQDPKTLAVYDARAAYPLAD